MIDKDELADDLLILNYTNLLKLWWRFEGGFVTKSQS